MRLLKRLGYFLDLWSIVRVSICIYIVFFRLSFAVGSPPGLIFHVSLVPLLNGIKQKTTWPHLSAPHAAEHISYFVQKCMVGIYT
jgi:hypothetical protein